ncbi:MAG: thioredoxin domain-containing protein [Desulfobacula sp.]|nr:thioredoxin domain-containing protein [Desulfobacula sp.]
MMNSKARSFFSMAGWVLIFAGFLDALYLSVSHYRVYTDITYSSFCAISKSVNCDTVSQSSFSVLFGMPVPIWGVLGYLFLILIFPFIIHKENIGKRLWAVFFITVTFYSIYSLILAFISTFFIHSYCLMCIVSYAINFVLVFYAYKIIKDLREGGILKSLHNDWVYLRSNTSRLFFMIKLFFAVVIVVWLVFPKYWHLEFRETTSALPSGITEDGSHWIGAENPDITIIEYTDYLCFQCRKMHYYLRELVAEHPHKIRLIHRHFPLDIEFNFAIKENLHSGAGKMAMLAIYAGLKNKFWEMNDLLFQIHPSKGSIDLNEIAVKIDLKPEELAWALEQKEIRLHLKRDVALAVKAGVTGTPSYIINDNLYLGTIPLDILK